MSIEAMKRWLAALETCTYTSSYSKDFSIESVEEAAIEIRQAIALQEGLVEQAQKQEPVAWRWENAGQDKWLHKYTYLDNGAPDCPEKCEPLYTSPPQRQWVGLTPREIQEMKDEGIFLANCDAITEVIEAALKEKNT